MIPHVTELLHMRAFRTSDSLAVLWHISPEACDRKLSLTVRNTLTYATVQSILGEGVMDSLHHIYKSPPCLGVCQAQIKIFNTARTPSTSKYSRLWFLQ